jgi:AraC family transcriptional regulator
VAEIGRNSRDVRSVRIRSGGLTPTNPKESACIIRQQRSEIVVLGAPTRPQYSFGLFTCPLFRHAQLLRRCILSCVAIRRPDELQWSARDAARILSGSYESEVIGDRFRLDRPPTLLARTASVAPIGFTRLKSEGAPLGRTKDAPTENAYLFHVQLQPAAVDMWIDGKHKPATTTTPGITFLYDLRSNPVAEIYSSFDNVRFYISQTSLDELAFDQGIRRTEGLVSSCLGSHDRVMYGLANALLDHVERANERSALFIDHIALAFHAHVMKAYGNVVVPDTLTSGTLSPWQLRRALDFLSAHLSGDPTVAELARECGCRPAISHALSARRRA